MSELLAAVPVRDIKSTFPPLRREQVCCGHQSNVHTLCAGGKKQRAQGESGGQGELFERSLEVEVGGHAVVSHSGCMYTW